MIELKEKLDDLLANGLKDNSYLLYIVSIEKHEENRYVFSISFYVPILLSLPLSRSIIFNTIGESYMRKDMPANIFIVILFMLLLLIYDSNPTTLIIITACLSFLSCTLIPNFLLRIFMKRNLHGYNRINSKL